jgi:hypothetical protein
MTTAPDGREIIPAGEMPEPGYQNLVPIAKFLIEERGHLPIDKPEKYGFRMGDCRLTRSITAEDWAAINERFVLPDHVAFMFGYLIRDGLNSIDILGFDTYTSLNGVQGIEGMEEEIRQRDAHLESYGEAL